MAGCGVRGYSLNTHFRDVFTMKSTRALPFLAVLLLLTACASTTKQASWTNPQYSGGKVGAVFIIGTARSELNRRLFEDELARQLQARGVRGITSYQHLDSDQLDDRAATEAKVEALGADAVIVAKVVGTRVDTVVNPGRTYVLGGSPYYPRHFNDYWYDYYRSSYRVIHSPATITDVEVYTVETNLYGTDQGMIWTMQSETIAGGQIDRTIRDFVRIVIDDLAANGLI